MASKLMKKWLWGDYVVVTGGTKYVVFESGGEGVTDAKYVERNWPRGGIVWKYI